MADHYLVFLKPLKIPAGFATMISNNHDFSLLERHVIVGDLLTANQMSEIENLKLPDVTLQSDWTSDDIFIFLNDYLDKIGMTNLQPRIQIRRVFYRRMNEDNWLEKGRIPWLNIFTIIIEHKILRLSSSAPSSGEYLCLPRDRIFAPFVSCPSHRLELDHVRNLPTQSKPSYRLILETESDSKLFEDEETTSDAEVEKIDEPEIEIKNVEKSKSRAEQDSDELETNPKSAKIRRISHEKDEIDSRKISRESIQDDREMDYLAEKDPLQELFREVESQFDEQIQKSKKTAVDAKGL